MNEDNESEVVTPNEQNQQPDQVYGAPQISNINKLQMPLSTESDAQVSECDQNTFKLLQNNNRPRKVQGDFISPRFPSNQKHHECVIHNQLLDEKYKQIDDQEDFTKACKQVTRNLSKDSFENSTSGNDQQSNVIKIQASQDSLNQIQTQIPNADLNSENMATLATPERKEPECKEMQRFSFGRNQDNLKSGSLSRRSKNVEIMKEPSVIRKESTESLSQITQPGVNSLEINGNLLFGRTDSFNTNIPSPQLPNGQHDDKSIPTFKFDEEESHNQSLRDSQRNDSNQTQNNPQVNSNNNFKKISDIPLETIQDENESVNTPNNANNNIGSSGDKPNIASALVLAGPPNQQIVPNTQMINVQDEYGSSLQAIDNQGQFKETPNQVQESQRGYIRLTTLQSQKSPSESPASNDIPEAIINTPQQVQIQQQERPNCELIIKPRKFQQKDQKLRPKDGLFSPKLYQDHYNPKIKQADLKISGFDTKGSQSVKFTHNHDVNEFNIQGYDDDLASQKESKLLENMQPTRKQTIQQLKDREKEAAYQNTPPVKVGEPECLSPNAKNKGAGSPTPSALSFKRNMEKEFKDLGYDPNLNSSQLDKKIHVDEFLFDDKRKHFNQPIDHQKFIERKHRAFLDNIKMMELEQQQELERIREREKAGHNKDYWISNRRDHQLQGSMTKELFDKMLNEFEPVQAADSEDEEEPEPVKRYGSLKKVLFLRYKQHREKSNHLVNQQTQAISQLLQDGSGQSINQIQRMLKDNPEWICNIMNSQPKLGLFLMHFYRIITFRACSRQGSKNKVDDAGQEFPDQFQIETIQSKPEQSNPDSSDMDQLDPEQRKRQLEWKEKQKKKEKLQMLRRKYCQQSLGHFDLDHPFRLFFINIVESSYFEKFILILIVINSLFLGIMDYTWTGEGQIPLGNKIAENSEIFFTIFFTFECLAKIISMGFIFHKKCYLRNGWNNLDFMVVVTGLLNNLPGMSNVSSLRTFRLFRPLRSLSQFPSMRMLITTLFISFHQLGNILILDIFFILTFSLFGLQLWGGIVHYRCRKTPHPVNGDWEVVEDDKRLCGSFHQCAPNTYCGSLFETRLPGPDGTLINYELSDELKKNLLRDSQIQELNYGITNFDTIASSYLTIFQCTTLEGWSKIMQMMQDGYSLFFSTIFFIALVIVCSYFLLNLTVAVMLDNFKQLNDSETAQFIEKYENNRHRIKQLKSLDAALGRLKFLKSSQAKKILFRNFCRNNCFRHPGYPKRPSDKNKFYRYDYKVCLYSWMIIKQPIFSHFIMLLIILNTLILASDQYPQQDIPLFSNLSYVFTLLFSMESGLKLLGLTRIKFKKDKFNLFDLFIVTVSIIELVTPSGNFGIITSLRAFRLARLFKLARSNHTLKCLLDSIAQTISAIANFIVLLLLFIYVFALLGMTMFAGKFSFDDHGYHDPSHGSVPRMNFDTLDWAIITVFQIMVGDQWQQVMYLAIESTGSMSVIFFVSLVLFGNFIMLNLFLAILLGNFEISSLVIRSQYEDQILKNFEKQLVWHNQQLLNEKDISIEESEDRVDSDDSTHKKDQQREKKRMEKIEQIHKDYLMFVEHEKETKKDLSSGQRTTEDLSRQFNYFRRQTKLIANTDNDANQKQNKDFVSPINSNEPFEYQKTPQTQEKLNSAENFLSGEQVISPQVNEAIQNQILITQQKDQFQSPENFQFKRISTFSAQIVDDDDKAMHYSEAVQNEGAMKAIEVQQTEGTLQDKNQQNPKRVMDLMRPAPLQTIKSNFSFSANQQKQNQNSQADPNDKVVVPDEPNQDQFRFKHQLQFTNFQPTVVNSMPESLASSILSQNNKQKTGTFFGNHIRFTNFQSKKKEPSFDSSIDITDIIQQKVSVVRSSYHQKYQNQNALNTDKGLRFSTSTQLTPFQQALDGEKDISQECPKEANFCSESEHPYSERSNCDSNKNGAESARPLNPDKETPIANNKNQESSEQNFSMQQLMNYKEKADVFLQDLFKFMSESSLFILHKDTALRKFLIKLTIKKVRKKQKNLFEKDKMIQKINGGNDGEESDEMPDDCKNSDKDNEHIQDPVLDVHFGLAMWTGETFEEYMDNLKAKEEQQCSHKQEMKKIDNKKNFNGDNNQYNDQDSDQSESDQQLSEDEDQEEFQFKYNKQIVLKKIQFVIKNGGHDHDLENVVEAEFQKKYASIQNGKVMGQIGRRPALKFQKNLERDYEEILVSMDKYYGKLQFFNKMRLYKSSLEKKCPFLLWSLNTWFENFIYFFILLAMLLLVIDNPNVDPESQLSQWMIYFENIIIIVFFIEVILRILATGFFHSSLPGKKGYICLSQNQIDFSVSILVDMLIQSRNLFPIIDPKYNEVLRSFKVLRCLRTLRTLRMIARTEALRLAIGSLFGALPAIGNAIIVCSLILCIYAILGISLFKGHFFYCSLDNTSFSKEIIKQKLQLVDTKEDCLRIGGQWLNNEQNFDNIWNAIPLLCEIITTEGWLDIMYVAIDSRGIDLHPKENSTPFAALFFTSFIIIGNIFILNLFVGVVIDKFNHLRDKMFGYLLMTRDQRLWIDKDKQMIRIQVEPKKEPPEQETMLIAYQICNHKNFDLFINFCIFLGVIQMALRYYTMNKDYLRALQVIGNILTLIYNIEAIIKIIAYESGYFKLVWNKFDFMIVIIADLAFIGELSSLKDDQFFKFLIVLKSLRIIRIFRVIRVNHNMMILTDSLIIIMPCVINIGSLILLLFFIFGVIGNNLFSNVIHQVEINDNNNFETFMMSLIVLMRCTTGEGWNKIMRELAITKDKPIYRKDILTGEVQVEYCVQSQTYEDFKRDGPKECGNIGSYIFFGVFIVTIQMMMLNLFIAVVIEGFSSTNKEHTGVVTQKDYQDFIDHWLEFDQDASGWIYLEDLIFLMHKISAPLGFIEETQTEKYIDESLRTLMRTMTKNSQLIDFKSKFIVDQKHNLIISQKNARGILDFLRLPVYKCEVPLKYKCHIAHVLKRLTFIAFKNANPNFDPYGIDLRHLNEHQRQWEFKYPSLVKDEAVERYDSGRIWSILFIVSNIKKRVNQKKLLDQEVAYNWKGKDIREQEAKLTQSRLAAANLKLLQQKKHEMQIQYQNQLLENNVNDPEQKNPLNRNSTHLPDDQQMQTWQSNTQKKLNKAQMRKLKIAYVLKKVQKQKEKDKFDNWQQDQAFEEYLDKILVAGPLFRKYYTAINNEKREREIDKNEYKILSTSINQAMRQGIKNTYASSKLTSMRTSDASMSQKDHQMMHEKDYKRSTWWCNENQKSYKIQRWLQNQEVIYQLKNLQKNNYLDPKADLSNIPQGIELLIKTIYELNGNVDNDSTSQRQLRILQDTLEYIEQSHPPRKSLANPPLIQEEQSSSYDSDKSREISLLGFQKKEAQDNEMQTKKPAISDSNQHSVSHSVEPNSPDVDVQKNLIDSNMHFSDDERRNQIYNEEGLLYPNNEEMPFEFVVQSVPTHLDPPYEQQQIEQLSDLKEFDEKERKMSFGEKLMLEEYDSPSTINVKKDSIGDFNNSRNIILEKTSFAATVVNELKGPQHGEPSILNKTVSSKSARKFVESPENIENSEPLREDSAPVQDSNAGSASPFNQNGLANDEQGEQAVGATDDLRAAQKQTKQIEESQKEIEK